MLPLTISVLPRLDRTWGLSDTSKRSLLKTISWRVTGSAATFLIAFLLTGNFAMAGTIGVAQAIVNTVLYYLHERAWNKIPWGR